MFPLRDNIRLTRVSLVTAALVAINVVVYLLGIRHGGSFLGGPSAGVAVHYGAIPYEFTHPGRHCYLVPAHTLEGLGGTVACQRLGGTSGLLPALGRLPAQPATWETAFTSTFLHGSFLQIFGNMLFLAILRPHRRGLGGAGPVPSPSTCSAAWSRWARGCSWIPPQRCPCSAPPARSRRCWGATSCSTRGRRVLGLVPVVFAVTIVAVPALALLGFWFVMQLLFSVAAWRARCPAEKGPPTSRRSPLSASACS